MDAPIEKGCVGSCVDWLTERADTLECSGEEKSPFSISTESSALSSIESRCGAVSAEVSIAPESSLGYRGIEPRDCDARELGTERWDIDR